MRSSAGGVSKGQTVVAEALVRVAVPVAGVSGLALLAFSAIAGDASTVVPALIALTIAAASFYQMRRRRVRPLILLTLVTLGYAAGLPFADRTVAAATLPTLAIFVFVGIFVLRRRTAVQYAIWCAVIAAWSVRWLYPDITIPEIAALTLMLGSAGFAGFKLLARAADALLKEEDNFRVVFDSSPVATWEEDFTAVGLWLETLRAAGVRDLRTHLRERPDEVKEGAQLIRIVRVNPAAAELVEADSTDQVVEYFSDVARNEAELESFSEQFIALWEGRRHLGLDLHGLTFGGRTLEAVLHWSVPLSHGRPDLSRVIVTISDITPRKVVEDRLQAALVANQHLLSFEQAIATCSQALLLGKDEGALEIALHTLREATNAEASYLCINVDDPELGPSFHLVHISRNPALPPDERVGRVLPWSAWPDAYEQLSDYEIFKQIVEPTADKPGIARLGVPILAGDQWVGVLGFEDYSDRVEWPEEAIKLIQVAAPMLGTYWERETTRRKLEELVRSKDRFVASVSHELRTPLAAVLGFAEELANRAESYQPAELTELLQLIADQSRDMSDMVEDLLVAARADIGTISVRPQDVYLRSQAESALAAIDSPQTDRVSVKGGPGKAWADPTRTRQIIRNLLLNALRYGGNKVVAEATTVGNVTTLAVRDNGPGLHISEWERIFEPYQRAHDRPTQPGSIGLGLTVSRQLARLMGGDLTYRSVNSESVFELTLPAHQPYADETIANYAQVAAAS